ncbi:unnamed protein product [Phaeothamnion confervicola]
MNNASKLFLTVTALTTLFVAGPASAQTTFDKNHPRRAEVIHRENRELNKNKAAYQNGSITKGQERRLNREDHAIRREERRDARRNGGYITKAQQARMNRQENRVNAQRRNDEIKDGTR